MAIVLRVSGISANPIFSRERAVAGAVEGPQYFEKAIVCRDSSDYATILKQVSHCIPGNHWLDAGTLAYKLPLGITACEKHISLVPTVDQVHKKYSKSEYSKVTIGVMGDSPEKEFISF